MSSLGEVIGSRIREMRQQRGWSMAHLAERAGTTAPTIMKIERSMRSLDVQWLERFAKAFDVAVEDLVLGDQQFRGVRCIPLVGHIAAGNWEEAVLSSREDVFVPASMAPGRDVFALRAQGESMNLIVPDGGLVIVDPHDAELLEGKIYAVMNDDGETTVKRFRHHPARLEPCSSSPDYKPILLGRSPFTVVGRVIGTYSAL